jgi:hypothetical protein
MMVLFGLPRFAFGLLAMTEVGGNLNFVIARELATVAI